MKIKINCYSVIIGLICYQINLISISNVSRPHYSMLELKVNCITLKHGKNSFLNKKIDSNQSTNPK